MTPTERWPSLLVHLDSDTWTPAADLARAVGVSERTVYRDVKALVDAGVPLQGVPGKGYRLPDDYLTKPVTFTTDEAIMLVLGSTYAAQNVEGRYRAAARAAHQKVNALLPSDQQERALALQGSVHLVPPTVFGTTPDATFLARVRQAMVEQRRVQMTADGGPSFRLQPYGLVHHGSAWYVVGRRSDHDQVAHIRLTNVENVTLTDERFERPDGYRTTGHDPKTTADTTVRVVFAARVASDVEVAPSVHVAEREVLQNGRLLLTLRVQSEVHVLPWLLSWGRYVRILTPTTLRERLIMEARAAIEQYDAVPTLLDPR